MSYLKDKRKYLKRLNLKRLTVKHINENKTFANMDAQKIIKKALDKRREQKFSHSFCVGYIIGLSDNDKNLQHYCINAYLKKQKSDKHMNAFFNGLSDTERSKWL